MRTVFPWQIEDRLKAEFFGPLRNGFFVEVGANAPQRGSQSWQFEQAGWDGVLVEPQPDLAEQLRKLRRAHVAAVACSSPANAGKTMTLHVLGPHSSLNRELAVTGVIAETEIEVPIRTLDAILEEIAAPAPIDFVSIDVEGHELSVFQGAHRVIESSPNIKIIMEWSQQQMSEAGVSPAAMQQELRDLGLFARRVPTSKSLHDITPENSPLISFDELSELPYDNILLTRRA